MGEGARSCAIERGSAEIDRIILETESWVATKGGSGFPMIPPPHDSVSAGRGSGGRGLVPPRISRTAFGVREPCLWTSSSLSRGATATIVAPWIGTSFSPGSPAIRSFSVANLSSAAGAS